MRLAGGTDIARVCCYGSGLIGTGWAAHFLRAGLDVVAFDPDPAAEDYLRSTVDRVWPTLERLGLAAGADPGRLSFTTDPRGAVDGVQFVQESATEDESVKVDLLASIDAQVDERVVIASSSSGFLARTLRSRCRAGGRVVVGHPFNPPYLIPLVEVVGGEGADPASVAVAMDFYRSVGSRPVLLGNEIPGYIANRLQFAVMREVLYLLSENVAGVAEIDEALVHGPGLRWAVHGLSRTFYMGARTPEAYPEFVDLLVDELAQGYAAPAGFDVDGDLAARYARDVEATSGPLGHRELKAARDAAIVAIRETLAGQRPIGW